MIERLECVVLSTPFTHTQPTDLQGTYAAGRLVLKQHVLANTSPSHALVEHIVYLRRYDVCLIEVCAANLAWMRTNLQAVQGKLSTPLLGITRDLTAPALNDLLALGLTDFIRTPFCIEELRVRCQQAVRASAGPVSGQQDVGPQDTDAATDASAYVSEPPALYGGLSLPERTDAMLERYATATATQGPGSALPLKTLKSHIISQFESAYIRAALHRHDGNIASAARSARKHRRAFWALMRKYDIDPKPYRDSPSCKRVPPKSGRAVKMPLNTFEG